MSTQDVYLVCTHFKTVPIHKVSSVNTKEPCELCSVIRCDICDEPFPFDSVVYAKCMICQVCENCYKDLENEIDQKKVTICSSCGNPYSIYATECTEKQLDYSKKLTIHIANRLDQIKEAGKRFELKLSKIEKSLEKSERQTQLQFTEFKETVLTEVKGRNKRLMVEATNCKDGIDSAKRAITVLENPHSKPSEIQNAKTFINSFSNNGDHQYFRQDNNDLLHNTNISAEVIPGVTSFLVYYDIIDRTKFVEDSSFCIGNLNYPREVIQLEQLIADRDQLEVKSILASKSGEYLCYMFLKNGGYYEDTLVYVNTLPESKKSFMPMINGNLRSKQYKNLGIRKAGDSFDNQTRGKIKAFYTKGDGSTLIAFSDSSETIDYKYIVTTSQNFYKVEQVTLLGFSWPCSYAVLKEEALVVEWGLSTWAKNEEILIKEINNEIKNFGFQGMITRDNPFVRVVPYSSNSLLFHTRLYQNRFALVFVNIKGPELIYRGVDGNCENDDTYYIPFGNYVLAIKASVEEFVRVYEISCKKFSLVVTKHCPVKQLNPIKQAWIGQNNRLFVLTTKELIEF